MPDTMGPNTVFVVPGESVGHGFDKMYTYHVVVDGLILFKARMIHAARNVAACIRGQLWRTPISSRYPAFCLCDFEKEQRWQSSVN